MSWRLKVSMLTKQGKTREQAMEEVLDSLETSNKDMDSKLAACMEHLNAEQTKKIFGDGW